MCGMTNCKDGDVTWTMVTQAYGGPNRDHTNLPNGNGTQGKFYRINYSQAFKVNPFNLFLYVC